MTQNAEERERDEAADLFARAVVVGLISHESPPRQVYVLILRIAKAAFAAGWDARSNAVAPERST